MRLCAVLLKARCVFIRVVAFHLLDKYSVHTLLIAHWEPQESHFCVKISWKLEEISKSVSYKHSVQCIKIKHQ